VREIMVEEVKEINSNSKTKGLVYWTGLVPHGGIRNAIQNQQGFVNLRLSISFLFIYVVNISISLIFL